MKILIADDDPVSRRLLQSRLVRMGHEVVAVSDGLSARDALMKPDAPRLAILDWMMPEFDGLAVCRDVRRRKDGPYVYVILLTARATQADKLAALDSQVDDFLTKPFEVPELQARIQSGARIIDLQQRLLDTQSQIQHEAAHDRLTGLWNRGMIMDHLGRELARSERTGEAVIVALVDVDHFKRVNDTLGHDSGDEVLQQVAIRMKGVLRKTDAVGRYGGEEFLLVLCAPGADVASPALERVRAAISHAPIALASGPLAVTVSIGVSVARPGEQDAGRLITDADRALYLAKANGRNRVTIAGDETERAGRPVPWPAGVAHDDALSVST